jgi:4-amino-4-deoxy-L-arabinose transferase-like glycosyltransferase/membrane-associated phospholipid phosphatase
MLRAMHPWASSRLAAAAVALLFAIAFACLAHEAAERELLDADHAVSLTLQAWRQPVLDAPMQALSALGSGSILVPLNAALAWVLWRRRYRHVLLVPALTLGAVVTEAMLKWLVNRPRPKAVGYGFPSGHVMASIVFFGLVVWLLWRARHGDAVACIAAGVGVVVVAGIGVSRLYLNSHWLSDVLGGGAAGLAFLMFAALRLGPQLHERLDDGGGAALAASEAPPLRMRAGWVLAGGVVVLSLVDVGTRVLATDDEACFPVLAQSLLGGAGGHWLVPSLNGAPYVNKPPLLAWAIVAASWPVGQVTQLTAIIPSVLAGLVTVLLVYRLGRELWNTTAGRYAAAIAATTQGLFLHARLAMPDMMMTAFAALGFWALQRMRRRPDTLVWLVFYAAVAAGFWTKGPAGLMPLGIAIGYALWRRRAEPVRWLRLAPGLAVLALMLAPWPIVAAVRETDAMHRTFAVDYLLWYAPQRLSIMTVVTPLQHALGVLFPWVWLAPFAVHDAWRMRRGRGAERDAVLLVLVWAAAAFAMVAVSHQQRVRYYLPLVPPLSLLLGWWLATAAVQWRRVTLWPLRWTAAGGGVVSAVAVAWSLAQGRRAPEALAVLPTSPWQLVLIVAAAVTLVAGMEIGLCGRRLGRAFPVAAVAAALLVASLHHAEETRRNATENYAKLARTTQRVHAPGEPVATLGVPALPVAFYLGERVIDLASEADARADVGLVVADARRLAERGTPARVAARAMLGRREVVVARLGETGDEVGAIARTPISTPRPLLSRHIAFELVCVLVALAGIVGRTRAVRHGAPTAVVFLAEAVVILALASFPAHLAVFVLGLLAVAGCGYVRWRHPALVGRPHEMAGALFVLALLLDILEDVLQGKPVTADPVWMLAALLGLVLITWARVTSPSASGPRTAPHTGSPR